MSKQITIDLHEYRDLLLDQCELTHLVDILSDMPTDYDELLDNNEEYNREVVAINKQFED